MSTFAVFGPFSAEFPSTAFPQLTTIHSTARRPVLAYDAAADENALLSSVAPQGLTGTITAVVFGAMASATTGSVRLQVALEAVTPGDSLDLDTSESFDTDNSNGGTVPGTAGFEFTISVTMTNADALAAGDRYRLRVRRDADGTSGTDDATGDFLLTMVELRDAA